MEDIDCGGPYQPGYGQPGFEIGPEEEAQLQEPNFWNIVKDGILSKHTLNGVVEIIDDNIESCDDNCFKNIWKRSGNTQKISMVNRMAETYMYSIFDAYCDLKERGY